MRSCNHFQVLFRCFSERKNGGISGFRRAYKGAETEKFFRRVEEAVDSNLVASLTSCTAKQG